MSYEYDNIRPKLFTEEGVETLTQVRRNVEKALREAGAVRAIEAWRQVGGDNWLMLAALDYMLEKGEIREVSPSDTAGQHRVFVAAR